MNGYALLNFAISSERQHLYYIYIYSENIWLDTPWGKENGIKGPKWHVVSFIILHFNTYCNSLGYYSVIPLVRCTFQTSHYSLKYIG